MGVFNAANQWRAALLFIPSVVGQVLIPMTSSLRQSRNGRGIRSSVKAAIAVNGICALPLLLGLGFASGQIMNFYGPGFARHRIVLMMTAATGALMAVQGPIGNLIAGFGRMWVGALQNLAWASTLIIAAWVLLGRGWGAEGLALAYLISYVAHSTWRFWFGYRLLQQE
jgi:O-antigen/teichoic acid export membrane protein